jgi:hypothetical protein
MAFNSDIDGGKVGEIGSGLSIGEDKLLLRITFTDWVVLFLGKGEVSVLGRGSGVNYH